MLKRKFQSFSLWFDLSSHTGPVVQSVDNAIQQVNHYPKDVLTTRTVPSAGWRFI